MTPGVRPLVAGNWKMNGLSGSLAEIDAMRQAADAGESGDAELARLPAGDADRAGRLEDQGRRAQPRRAGLLTPRRAAPSPATFPPRCSRTPARVTSSSAIPSAGRYHHETDELVRAKAEAALKAGLTPIVCVGETHAEREAGEQAAVVIRQLRGSLPPEASSETVVVAYEPIWAIGTGLTPTPKDVAAVHNGIRALLADMYGPPCAKIRLLYGGSVKPSNCSELLTLDNVDGALVGGASLKATEFLAIAAAYR